MNVTQLTQVLAIAAAFAAGSAAPQAALAQDTGAQLTRAEVKAEARAATAAHAIPAGEATAPIASMVSTKTRADRKSETMVAQRAGALSSPGQALYKGYMSQRVVNSTKTRSDRKAATMDAIQHHQLMGAGEAG